MMQVSTHTEQRGTATVRVELSAARMHLLLAGIDVRAARYRKRLEH
jgi:hypothetical protein